MRSSDRRRQAAADPGAAIRALVEELGEQPGVAVRTDEPLAAHLPLRCGGPADAWAEVQDLAALRRTLRAARQHHQSWQIAWPFADRLVRDGGIRGLVVRPSGSFEQLALLAATDEDPARIRLGAAAPWAALARLAPDPDSPSAVLSRWPGCPGGTYDEVREGLEGLLWAVHWARGRSTDRTALPQGAQPPAAPRTAVLLDVEIPVGWPAGARRLRHRLKPPPLGTLFQEDEGLDPAHQLRAAGIVGSRLRTWHMARSEPGTLVALGPGDARSALLFAKGIAEHVRKTRGVELTQRLQVDGVDDPGPPSR